MENDKLTFSCSAQMWKVKPVEICYSTMLFGEWRARIAYTPCGEEDLRYMAVLQTNGPMPDLVLRHFYAPEKFVGMTLIPGIWLDYSGVLSIYIFHTPWLSA